MKYSIAVVALLGLIDLTEVNAIQVQRHHHHRYYDDEILMAAKEEPAAAATTPAAPAQAAASPDGPPAKKEDNKEPKWNESYEKNAEAGQEEWAKKNADQEADKRD